MKTNYEWQDKEVGEFYSHIATRKPSEQNRGGGVRISTNANFVDVEEINKGLDILLFYRAEFIEHRKFKYLHVIENARSMMFHRVYDWNRDMLDEITIPDENRGKMLVGSTLSKKLRALCNMLDSILNNKPNEMARAIFNIG